MVCMAHRLQCKTPHFPKHKFHVHATRNVQMHLKINCSIFSQPFLSQIGGIEERRNTKGVVKEEVGAGMPGIRLTSTVPTAYHKTCSSAICLWQREQCPTWTHREGNNPVKLAHSIKNNMVVNRIF